jgi:hypothetical protein
VVHASTQPLDEGALRALVPRVLRRVLRPQAQRLDQRFLKCVLGGVEVLAAPDETRQHARYEGAQRALVDHAGVSRQWAPPT